MEKYDIIVLAGQSNAFGQGLGDVTREYVPDERIHIMKDDANPKFVREDGIVKLALKWPAENTISVADERLNADGKKVGCFALQFAEKYVQEYLEEGRKVLIVYTCHGGTGFARPEWGVGNILHTRMLSMTRAALAENPEENRIVAFLWHQGEHDSFENADWDPERRYLAHKENVRATFADFYEQFGDNTIPVIAAGFIETDDLQSNNQRIGNGDPYHFCRESLHILGNRYFDEYRKLRK